jgi:hypothetical protein
MKCTRIGEQRCNCSCFEIDQEMDAILLIIGIVYGVCRIVIKSVQWWNKGKYFTLNSLSYHFSPFENENYHRFIISLQANNLTSLSPYAYDVKGALSAKIVNFCYPLKLSDMIDALIKRVSVTYKCYPCYCTCTVHAYVLVHLIW